MSSISNKTCLSNDRATKEQVHAEAAVKQGRDIMMKPLPRSAGKEQHQGSRSEFDSLMVVASSVTTAKLESSSTENKFAILLHVYDCYKRSMLNPVELEKVS